MHNTTYSKTTNENQMRQAMYVKRNIDGVFA